MRYIYILLALVIFTACSKSGNPTPSELIYGKWKYHLAAFDLNKNGIIDSNEISNQDNLHEYYTFRYDSTGIYNTDTSSTIFNWHISNRLIYLGKTAPYAVFHLDTATASSMTWSVTDTSGSNQFFSKIWYIFSRAN